MSFWQSVGFVILAWFTSQFLAYAFKFNSPLAWLFAIYGLIILAVWWYQVWHPKKRRQ